MFVGEVRGAQFRTGRNTGVHFLVCMNMCVRVCVLVPEYVRVCVLVQECMDVCTRLGTRTRVWTCVFTFVSSSTSVDMCSDGGTGPSDTDIPYPVQVLLLKRITDHSCRDNPQVVVQRYQ